MATPGDLEVTEVIRDTSAILNLLLNGQTIITIDHQEITTNHTFACFFHQRCKHSALKCEGPECKFFGNFNRANTLNLKFRDYICYYHGRYGNSAHKCEGTQCNFFDDFNCQNALNSEGWRSAQ